MAAGLSVDALEASDGDAILVSCRNGDQTFDMLVDGGRTVTAPLLRERLASLKKLDLLVVSHIDGDHIEGVVELLRGELPVPIGEIWFNGLAHIAGDAVTQEFTDLAPADGERLTQAIRRCKIPWNRAFDGEAVCVDQPGDVVVKRFGEVTLSVISPDRRRLRALGTGTRGWHPDPGDEEEPGGPFRSLSGRALPNVPALAQANEQPDNSRPNGSSIAFMLSYRDWRVLLCADAHPRLLCAGMRGLSGSVDAPVPVDVMKISHHGSRANTTRELLALLDCGTFLFSGIGPGRPHDETIAKIAVRSRYADLVFNYVGDAFERWDVDELKERHGYGVRLQPCGGIVLREVAPVS